MSKMLAGFIGTAAVVFPTLVASAALWGITWLSDPQPCPGITGGLQGPIISSFYPTCQIRGTNLSICPGTTPNAGPWNSNAAITVVGYEITMILSSSASQGVMEVGSYRTAPADGADVFATTAGVGTNSKTGFFPAGLGIPQGNNPGQAHFDIYAACDGAGAQFQALVNIYYTNP